MAENEWIFVYGTLRQGHGNNRMFGDAILKAHFGCTLAGAAIYNLRNSPSPLYPVLTLTGDSRDVVKGDLFKVDPDDERVCQVIGMEIGAGYHLERLPITLPDGRTKKAYVFVYGHPTEKVKKRCYHIASGDWNQFTQRVG